jgi:TatD DNase family protein
MSEIGLDYMQSMPNRAWQFDAFRQQIRIARELNLPIVFHSRDAHDDCFRVLREEKAYQVGGVMHYFQGSQYDAEQMTDMGFFISIECIVIETDAFPQPFKKNRENWTEPRHLRPIIEKIAELKSRDVREVEEVIFNNMKRLLQSRWDKVNSYISGT